MTELKTTLLPSKSDFGIFSNDGKIKYYYRKLTHTETGKIINLPQISSCITAEDISRCGKLLVLGFESCACKRCACDSSINVYNTTDGSLIKRFDHGTLKATSNVKISPDNSHVVVCLGKSIMAFAMETGIKLWENEILSTYPCDIYFTDNHNFLLATCNEYNDERKYFCTLHNYNILTGESTLYQTIPVNDWTRRLIFSNDGKFLACGGYSGNVNIITIGENDTKNMILQTSQPKEGEYGGGGDVRSMAFSLDKKYFAAGSYGYCDVWDLQKGEKIASLSRKYTIGNGPKAFEMSSYVTVSFAPNNDLYLKAEYTCEMIKLP
ncbi:MAG: hypothetical protein Edafosvirus1_38 [Edafosvirus sp.]|uniref:Uncharacterized protein n=1 Tax=Edafosvirus sp. TaxID=2487765 RepID=A0A3G4ZS33_9VIRU|nr:MAG: hypothetical protein Edafosvirus1_38 [Edafosvirus sp.]